MCYFRVKLVEARYFPKPHQWANQRQRFWFPHQSHQRHLELSAWKYHENPSCVYITLIYCNMTTVLGSFLFEVIWRRSLHRHFAALTIDDVPLLISPSTLEDCFEPQYQDFTPKGKVFQEKHLFSSCLVFFTLPELDLIRATVNARPRKF